MKKAADGGRGIPSVLPAFLSPAVDILHIPHLRVLIKRYSCTIVYEKC